VNTVVYSSMKAYLDVSEISSFEKIPDFRLGSMRAYFDASQKLAYLKRFPSSHISCVDSYGS
jgi:hypothetical protein